MADLCILGDYICVAVQTTSRSDTSGAVCREAIGMARSEAARGPARGAKPARASASATPLAAGVMLVAARVRAAGDSLTRCHIAKQG